MRWKRDREAPALVIFKSQYLLGSGVLFAGFLVRLLSLAAGRRPTDDAYIALRYAYNLAHTGKWFFNFPGEVVQGASSLLWVFVLTPFTLFLPSGDPGARLLLECVGLAFQLGAILIALVHGLLRGRNARASLILAILLVFLPTHLDQTFNGMEASGVLFLVTLLSTLQPGGIPWALCLGLLPLLRPESAVCVALPIWIVHFVKSAPDKAARQMLFRGALCAVGLGSVILGLVGFLKGGNPIPTTLLAKERTYSFVSPGLSANWPERVSTLTALVGFEIAGDGSWVRAIASALLASGLVAAVVLVLLKFRKEEAEGTDFSAWCVAWLATAVFHVVAVVRWSFPWYPALGAALASVILARGIDQVLTRFSARLALATVACLSLLTAGMIVYKARLATLAAIRDQVVARFSENDYEHVGLQIRQHFGSHKVVMLEPAGAIGFFSGLLIADTIGLVSPSVPETRTTSDCWYDHAVQALRPDVIVLRETEIRSNLDLVSGYRRILACSGNPIPPGYLRLTPTSPPWKRIDPALTLTILYRE